MSSEKRKGAGGEDQMAFNFFAEEDAARADKEKRKSPPAKRKSPGTPEKSQGREPEDSAYQPHNLKRAVIGWLLKDKPAGIGLSVPTRISKYKADVAAFWVVSHEKNILRPAKTTIVELRENRGECWPDCSKNTDLLEKLKTEKKRKAELQAEIRKNEPHLKDNDTLFSEYENWDYSKSGRREYHQCLRDIEKIEKSLYKGSRFEQIRKAFVADNLYLAVPAGSVHPDELAAGWGLLYIDRKLGVKEVKSPENWECPEENKRHLVTNIALSCKRALLFSCGIRETDDGKIIFTAPPRRRRGGN